jgi:hypothetical protein
VLAGLAVAYGDGAQEEAKVAAIPHYRSAAQHPLQHLALVPVRVNTERERERAIVEDVKRDVEVSEMECNARTL